MTPENVKQLQREYLDAREAYNAARNGVMPQVRLVIDVASSMKSDLDLFVATTIEGKKTTVQTAWKLDAGPPPKACGPDLWS
jgi:hypothetical protein